MSRLNWNDRQSPTDFDNTAPQEVNYNFDYRRCVEPGKPSWPEKHSGQKFGPSFIGKAWKAGLVVVAEIAGIPYPVAAVETRWGASGVLQVRTLEKWAVPDRLWTRADARGLTSSGLLIEGEESKN